MWSFCHYFSWQVWVNWWAYAKRELPGKARWSKHRHSKSTFWWHMSVIIHEFVRFYSSIIKWIWEASIVAKSVVEFEFEHQRSWNYPEIVKLLKKESYMIHRAGKWWISHCKGNITGNREHSLIPQTMLELTAQSSTSLPGGNQVDGLPPAHSFLG